MVSWALLLPVSLESLNPISSKQIKTLSLSCDGTNVKLPDFLTKHVFNSFYRAALKPNTLK